MLTLIETAFEVQTFMESKSWDFCFIGGIAVQRWGEVRVTKDVDLTLLTGFGGEEEFIRILSERFEPRISDIVEFALRNRVVVLKEGNIGIDVALGALDFEENVIKRASYHAYTHSQKLKTCSAEDLIVYKAFAERTKDWADVESIVIRQVKIDWDYVYKNLAPLAEIKYSPEIIDRLRDIQKHYYQK